MTLCLATRIGDIVTINSPLDPLLPVPVFSDTTLTLEGIHSPSFYEVHSAKHNLLYLICQRVVMMGVVIKLICV